MRDATSEPSVTILGRHLPLLTGTMIVQLIVGGALALALVFTLLSTLDARSKCAPLFIPFPLLSILTLFRPQGDKNLGPSSKYLSIAALTLPWYVQLWYPNL